MIEVQRARRAPAGRILGLSLVAWLLGVIVLCMLGGALYVSGSIGAAGPAIPAATIPPRARSLGASQTTQQLGGSGITSTGFYRSAASPAAIIAQYRRDLPGQGGQIGRFSIVVRDARSAAIPTALQHIPAAFADGTGNTKRVRYAFTEYADGSNDIGIAVDLRHPQGPTLVYVEMLSSG